MSLTKEKKKLSSLLDILNYSADLLKEKGINDARLNVELMLCEVLKCDRMKLYLDFEKPLSMAEITQFKQILKRRLTNEPLQYILGKTNFYGYEIEVNKNVLIPRQETEILVEKVLNDIINSSKQFVNIFEIGAGSGCISIALSGELTKKNIGHKIISIDKSTEAVELANKNKELNNISNNLEFSVCDLFEFQNDSVRFDYIVSNPPYISEDEFKELDVEVRDFEPKIALTDFGDGLKFYKEIFRLKKERYTDAKVFCEMAYNQSGKIKNLVEQYGFKDYEIYKDLSGIDRVIEVVN
ncbi:MAG TPA: peptide chain release factor N(5)-glutamine methyltransferase [Ignavibacteria bacterium]|nr:peptide chain release factor N(5)-glutamine methyltransferase [Ignavibacteria bacterium]